MFHNRIYSIRIINKKKINSKGSFTVPSSRSFKEPSSTVLSSVVRARRRRRQPGRFSQLLMLLSLHPPSSVPFSYSPPPGSSPLPSNCKNILIPREPPTGGRGESPNHRIFHGCNCGVLQPAYRGNKASVSDDAPSPSSERKLSDGLLFSDKPLAFSRTTPSFIRRYSTSRRLRPSTVAIPWVGSV